MTQSLQGSCLHVFMLTDYSSYNKQPLFTWRVHLWGINQKD